MTCKWERIAEGCLDKAIALLEKETAPDAATAEAVMTFAKVAVLVADYTEAVFSPPENLLSRSLGGQGSFLAQKPSKSLID